MIYPNLIAASLQPALQELRRLLFSCNIDHVMTSMIWKCDKIKIDFYHKQKFSYFGYSWLLKTYCYSERSRFNNKLQRYKSTVNCRPPSAAVELNVQKLILYMKIILSSPYVTFHCSCTNENTTCNKRFLIDFFHSS